MGNYSNDADSVRVDFFRDTGKWYTTEAVKMSGQYEGGSLYDIFIAALLAHLTQPDGTIRLAGMWAVCLDPYHEHSHPLMRRVPTSWSKVGEGG